MRQRVLLAAFLVVAWTGLACAAISQEEANQLGGPNLTAVGAEKAGNKDGSIPAFTGTPPAGYDTKATGSRPDPFAADKPLFSIDSKNMAQYADKLSEGTKALLAKYPTMKIDVYPTHRSAVYPQYVIDGTKKSAVTAKLENDGKKLTGAREGFPFPIPKTGLEAMWNVIMRWAGVSEHGHYKSFVINAAGRRVLASEGKFWEEYPYWDPKSTDREHHCKIMDNVIAPANRNNEGLIWLLKVDKSNGDPAWQYLPGQRRVKLAPEIAYDGPNTSVAGAATYDESYVFTGSPDRFEWKLLGKKEMYVPYNSYKFTYNSTADKVFGEHFVNPEYMRFELHRVWAIEGTLKSGLRHIYSKRVVYLDEDTWNALVHDTYDNKGKIYRVIYDAHVFNYDAPAPFTLTYIGYDLASGVYYCNAYLGETGGMKYIPTRPEKEWAPAALAGAGVR